MDSLVERLGEDHFDDRDGCRVRKGFDELCHERRKAAARITALESDNARLRDRMMEGVRFVEALADNDPDEPIADNGMTVLGALQFQAPALALRLRAALADMEQADVD